MTRSDDDARRIAFQRILDRKPALHYWPSCGGWRFGGFDDERLTWFFETVASLPSQEFRSIETGAGLTTLAFLAASPRRHVCVAPDSNLRARLLESAQGLGLATERLEFVVDRSESALPRLTEGESPFLDVALIDGAHGYPTPFVDFCFLNRALKREGLLFVDDVQIHPVRQLCGLLAEQPGWDLVEQRGKLALFRKLSSERYLPQHGAQPFVVRQSVREPGLGGASEVRGETQGS